MTEQKSPGGIVVCEQQLYKPTTQIESTDPDFNMIRMLNGVETNDADLRWITANTRGLAYYSLNGDELGEPLDQVGRLWIGVKVDDGDELQRPKAANTAFTTSQSLVDAFRTDQVRELLVPYIDGMDIEYAQALPEHNFDPIMAYDFDDRVPNIQDVSRVCDALNTSARGQFRHREMVAIIERVREHLEVYHEHEWQDGDMITWDDRAWLHWRVPTDEVNTDEVYFDNNSTWHIDDFEHDAIFSLAQIAGTSHQLMKNHHRLSA